MLFRSVRGAGNGFRLDARLLRKEFDRSAAIQHLLLRYMQSLLTQVSQSVACNRQHSVHQRLCRWLLLCLDRLSSAELAATHETIGEFLGVRRESVSRELGELKAAGIVSCHRGGISVVDRPNLEAHACACYREIKKELNHLLAALAPAAIQDEVTEHWGWRDTPAATRPHFAPVPAYLATRSAYAQQEEGVFNRRYPRVPA